MTTRPAEPDTPNLDASEGVHWHRGTTLAERIARWDASSVEAVPVSEADSARAARRLARWRARAPLSRDEVFARRLALDGANEAQLLRLLAEPPEALAARHGAAPEWQTRWMRLLARPAEAASTPDSGQASPFLNLVRPLIAESRARLVASLTQLTREYPEAPFAPESAVDLFLPQLERQLLVLLSRTLVLELNVAREEGRLQGESAEARYQDFGAQLLRPEVALALFAEYPVLARRLLHSADMWWEASHEMLERLAHDHRDIEARLAPPGGLDLLRACKLGVGDSHRGGRSVAMLRFVSGATVVYKPRSLAVDVHFHELIDWLNAHGATPAFRALKALDRGTYGWMEFVEARPCETREELSRFYSRLGGWLALMYTLEATDIHFENIIAVGEHPCLVDLESLFHPRFLGEGNRGAMDAAARAKDGSVMRMGLLPRRGWADEDSDGIDFSALGSTSGQMTPKAAQLWVQTGTDEMRLTRQRVEVAASANRPTLNGEEVGVLAFSGEFQDGFARMYRLLMLHREALLAPGGPVERFSSDTTRVILRPTYLYHVLDREGCHPDHLRDGLDLDRFFDRLWGTVDQVPYTEALIPFEREDLWRSDIPFFSCRPGSRDVWTSTGQRLESYFPRSGLELASERLQQLSEKGLTEQLWFIRASFTSLSVSAGGGRMPTYRLPPESGPLQRERLLERASALGDRLAATAFRGSADDAAWLGLTPVGERYWTLSPLDVDLYSGLSGIMLFLAYLGHVTGEARHTALARQALATVLQRTRGGTFSPRQLGATGDLGTVHALLHLGALWDEPALWDTAESLLAPVEARIAQDTRFDVLSGVAGLGTLMLELHAYRGSSRALDVALLCGERLLEGAQRTEQGLGWVTPLGPRPLTGFAHGVAGIAWFLLALGDRARSGRFRDAALRALAYERSEYSPEHRNWKDLRAVSAEGGFMTALCHGAPGIGLGRVLSLPYLDTPELREEIRIAMETTLAHGFGGNHSLCHGDLGNLEVLTLAAEALADAELMRRRDALTRAVVASLDTVGLLCGVPTGVETPGLMSGLSGIGYALLRLAEPERVPSLFAFEPPRQPSAGAALSACAR